MKHGWKILGAALAVMTLLGSAGAQTLSDEKERMSYSVGVDMGRNIQRNAADLDPERLIQGMRDVLLRKDLIMDDKDLQAALNSFQTEMKQRKMRAKMLTPEENLRLGEAFLSQNKEKEGVVTLPSGLQYKVIKAGEGKKPTEQDAVEVHFRGALVDGFEFDNSYRTGKPGKFKIEGTIPGWREALKLMPVGSKWEVFIPSQLAYGHKGSGRIGPNSTLVYDLELVGID